MGGRNLAKTTYLRADISHPLLSEDKIDVLLVSYPDYLSLHRQRDNKAVLSIPWHNIKNIRVSFIEKKGLSEAVEKLWWFVDSPGNMYHDGVSIYYWDDDYQRDLEIFLKSGGKRNAEKLTALLWRERDMAIRG